MYRSDQENQLVGKDKLLNMVKYTLFIAVCVAALFSQSLAVDELQSASKDEAKKAFHSLMEVIDKALTQAQNALNKAVDQVKTEADELEAKAKVQLDKLLVPLRKQLDDLIAKAKAKGFDVTTCQSYIDKFSNTPDDLVHNLVDCFNQQLSKAQSYVDDALNNAKKIEQDLNHIDSDIDNCGGNKWKQIKCYAKIIEEIAEDTKSAPQHIAEDVTKATALVTGIVPILEECFTNQLKKAGDDATKDVADFAICVAIPI